jgi:hypothetical protein
MSSLWTPGGEHPVGRGSQGGGGPDRGAGDRPGRGRPPQDVDAPGGGEQMPTEEELAALRDQLARTPASVVVANHCLGLWELAALHLSLHPPQLDQAAVAIDALGAIVERLEGRLADEEATLREGLAQLRLAFVQVKASSDASAAPHASHRQDDS